MASTRWIMVGSVLAAVAVAAAAQGGPGGGMGPGMKGAGPGASAPGMGMGMGMRQSPGARWGGDYTPGWTMMTEQERAQHQERMRSMHTYEECHAYVQQHHEQMAARAKERGGKALAQPRRDACAALKK